jgi:site-specific DNA recombinase
LKALQEYCKDNGIEVVGTYEEQFSGNSLDRPGLDAVRDVVSSGGIDLVLCQDRDRISREPAYRFLIDEEFRAHGTTLRCLNDRGDDSPEGELTDGMLDLLAKYEMSKILERTRRGKLQKAQSGKIVGTGSAPYGFFYQDDHYHVDPDRMPYAREIFEKAAAGDSLYSIVQYLTRVGAPTPKCGRWHASTVRQIIQSDTYAGTFYWNKNRVTTKHVSVMKNGEKVYKRKVTTDPRPQSEWIAIRVPNSGIDAETVARARKSLKGNTKSVSKNSGRTWELSGGVGICSECGRHMVPYTTTNSAGKTYYYYRCSNRQPDACSNMKHRPAQDLETQVNDAIVEAFHPEGWEDFVNDVCDRKLSEIRRVHRSDPDQTRERLASRIEALRTKILRAQNLFIDGDLTRPQYEEKKSTFEDEIEIIQKELSKTKNLDREIRRIEALRRTLMSFENPLSGYYELTDDFYVFTAVSNKLYYGSKEDASRRRQDFYRKTGLRVKVGEENLEISLSMDRIFVSRSDTASVSSSGSISC